MHITELLNLKLDKAHLNIHTQHTQELHLALTLSHNERCLEIFWPSQSEINLSDRLISFVIGGHRRVYLLYLHPLFSVWIIHCVKFTVLILPEGEEWD